MLKILHKLTKTAKTYIMKWLLKLLLKMQNVFQKNESGKKSQKLHDAEQMRDYIEIRDLILDAAEKILAPKKSSLQAVSKDMDKNTKDAARQANKQITDTLAQPVTERIKKVRSGRNGGK